jgi:hypothetical protein
MRCVSKSTVSDWSAISTLVDAVDGKVGISQLSSFQPSHAKVIARAFRKSRGEEWDEQTKSNLQPV